MHIDTRSTLTSVILAVWLAPACAVSPAGQGETQGEAASASLGESGAGTATETGTETGDPPQPYTCNNPKDVLQTGSQEPSGFVRCDDGFVHRVAMIDALVPNWPDSQDCANGSWPCSTADDCKANPYGACVYDINQGCLCKHGCVTDADCNDGYVCAPAGVAGPYTQCVFADCKSDADCGDGLCGLSAYQGCCAMQYQLKCAGPIEECHGDANCEVGPCEWDTNGVTQYECVIQNDLVPQGVGEWTCKMPPWCSCAC